MAADLADMIGQCEWPNPDPAISDLLSGENPVASLVKFVESGSKLAEEEWDRLRGLLTEHFSQSLAIAASRCKLRVIDAPESPLAARGFSLERPLADARGSARSIIYRAAAVRKRLIPQAVRPIPPSWTSLYVRSKRQSPLK
jgi:hypothetical protein